jgi:gas vesicle protein
MSNESGGFSSGFFAGALAIGTLGVAAVMLLGTKRGENLTKMAADTYHDVEDAAGKMMKKHPVKKIKTAAKKVVKSASKTASAAAKTASHVVGHKVSEAKAAAKKD